MEDKIAIICEHCQTKYKILVSRLSTGIQKLKCSHCHQIFNLPELPVDVLHPLQHERAMTEKDLEQLNRLKQEFASITLEKDRLFLSPGEVAG